ncbi:MAG: hypothetical protein ACOC7K_00890 [bacterium]
MKTRPLGPFPTQKEWSVCDPRTRSGNVIQVAPPEGGLGSSQTTSLVKTNRLEVIRLVVTPKKAVPTHEFQGESVIECVRGRVVIGISPTTLELNAGQLVHYSGNKPFSVKAIEESLLLVTIVLPARPGDAELLG